MLRKTQPAPVAAPPVSVHAKGNRFAALDSYDTDSDTESVEESQEPVPIIPATPIPVSVAPIDDSFTLVTGGRKGDKRATLSKTSSDGWTKVQWNKPQFIDSDSESETEIKKELELEAREVDIPDEEEDIPPPLPETLPVEGFGSLLNRGKSASLWADKIKDSLDKAENARKGSGSGAPPGIKPTEDFVSGLGHVSFFSRAGFGPRT